MKKLLVILICLSLVFACTSVPPPTDVQKLPPSELEKKKAQEKTKETIFTILEGAGATGFTILVWPGIY